jgi:hypothetical protein
LVYSTRPALLVAIALTVAGICVLSALDTLGKIGGEPGNPRGGYGVDWTIDRMANARGLLPPGERVVYLSDVGPGGSTAGTLAFLTTQYALAPRLLVLPGRSRAAERAIGNFSARSVDPRAFGEAAGYDMVRDCGQGVAVYRRKGR